MQDFANLCNVYSYISVSQFTSREIQAFVLKLGSINNQKEQTAKSNIQSVSNAPSLCLSLALGYIPEPRGRAPDPLESAARWHRALALPCQQAQLSLNEILLSSPFGQIPHSSSSATLAALTFIISTHK